MASYHLSCKIISRSSGRGSVATAAYRSRSRLKDDRIGQTFNYTKAYTKETSIIASAAYRSRSQLDDTINQSNPDYSSGTDLGYSEIILPENTPERFKDRQTLWNEVETVEKRKDAQLAREIEIAVPIELDLKTQIELTREFTIENFVSEGMIADVNIHSKENNPHVHILLTTRDVTTEGFGKKNRTWNQKHKLLKWRESWASIQNKYLLNSGYDVRVDHRSYEDRGIDFDAQVKLGVIAHHKNKSSDLDRVAEYHKTQKENGQKILKDPSIVIDALTYHSSTFSHEDIQKFVHAHTHTEQFYDALKAVENCPDLVKIHEEEYDRFSRYTSKKLQHLEKELCSDTIRLQKRSRSHRIKKSIVSQELANTSLSEEQKQALLNTINGNDLSVIIGHAGTGKSYTLKAIKEVYRAKGYDIQGVAPSGVAADGMEQSSGIRSSTIHSKIIKWDNEKELLNEKTVLVIDEAGMVGTRQMNRLVKEAEKKGSKIIAVGDLKQTQAVEAGGAFRAMVERSETISTLKQVWRQEKEWQKEATRYFSGSKKDIHKALELYRRHNKIKHFKAYDDAISGVVKDYMDGYNPDENRLILTHKNSDVDELNKTSRAFLKETDILNHPDHQLTTATGKKHFCAGDRILFTKNDTQLSIKNGNFGTIQSIDSNQIITIELDDNRWITLDAKQYNSFTHGYAATVNKTQGATIPKTFFLASEGVDRHLAYVAMSRHKKDVNLYYSKDKYQNFEQLKQQFANAGDKELLADFDTKKISRFRQFINRLTRSTAVFGTKKLQNIPAESDDADDPMDIDHVMDEVVLLGQKDNQTNFSTKKMMQLETKLFTDASELLKQKNHQFDRDFIEKVMGERILDEHQQHVFEKVINGHDMSIIQTQHITDKGYILSALKDAYEKKGYITQGVSLSGLGSDGLEKSTGIQSVTLSQKMWEWEGKRNELTEKSVLFVDAANMIGTESFHTIVDQAKEAKAKLIAVGDLHSLQAIESGGALKGIVKRNPGSMITLKKTYSSENWQQKSQNLIKEKEHEKALDLYIQNGSVISLSSKNHVMNAMVKDWTEDMLTQGSSSMMIAYLKKDVAILDEMAHEKLKDLNFIGHKEINIDGLMCSKGEKIMFLAKNNDLGVKNGSLGTIENIDGHKITVKLDTDKTIEVDTLLYKDIKYGYATNIHKSSGVLADRTYIYATKHIDRNTVGTMLSTHKKEAKIYHHFKKNHTFKKILTRDNPKNVALDFKSEKNLSGTYITDTLKNIYKGRVSLATDQTVCGVYTGDVSVGTHHFSIIKTKQNERVIVPFHEDLVLNKNKKVLYNIKNNNVFGIHHDQPLTERQRDQTIKSVKKMYGGSVSFARENEIVKGKYLNSISMGDNYFISVIKTKRDERVLIPFNEKFIGHKNQNITYDISENKVSVHKALTLEEQDKLIKDMKKMYGGSVSFARETELVGGTYIHSVTVNNEKFSIIKTKRDERVIVPFHEKLVFNKNKKVLYDIENNTVYDSNRKRQTGKKRSRGLSR